MTKLTIDLPEAMRAFIEEQASREGFVDAGEYVRFLVRDAQALEWHEAVDDGLAQRLRREPELAAEGGTEIEERERERRIAELRRQLAVGLAELERGDYTEYTDETLPQLFEAIKTGGRRRLDELKRALLT